MSTIAERVCGIRENIPATARLVAVSKFNPATAIEEAYSTGQRLFGESTAQELRGKYEILPKDIEWHFIGHLQSNKVKYIIPYIAMIESVDSLKLLQEIDKQAEKIGRTPVPCLLEIFIAQEDSKYGLSMEECKTLLLSEEFKNLKHICIHGFMAIASDTDNIEQVRDEFRSMKQFFDEMKEAFPPTSQINICELSMGMSHDYMIALEEGSTLVRVGSSIFGARIY